MESLTQNLKTLKLKKNHQRTCLFSFFLFFLSFSSLNYFPPPPPPPHSLICFTLKKWRSLFRFLARNVNRHFLIGWSGRMIGSLEHFMSISLSLSLSQPLSVSPSLSLSVSVSVCLSPPPPPVSLRIGHRWSWSTLYKFYINVRWLL